jgi:hypothetical protein
MQLSVNLYTTGDPCQRTNFYFNTNPFNGILAILNEPPDGCTIGAGNCPAPYQFTEMYSYVPGGAVSERRLPV